MARRAEGVDPRFRRLKLKLGGRDGLDVERVRAVRGVTDLPLMVDVNEWWTLDEALDACDALSSLGVEYVEQPLRQGDADGVELRRRSKLPIYVDEDCHTLADVATCAEIGVEYCEQPLKAGDDGGRELRARSPIPIYVDEDCHTLADVEPSSEIAHGINIMLAKSGGIREAIRMVHAARSLRMGVMLGCMLESGLGIAAGCCVAPLCDHVDLDGNILLREDPWPGVELLDGIQVPSLEPGLGVAARA